MATFTCEKHPSLLVIGGGQFVDGKLEATGDAADKVKRASKRFGITEGDDTATEPASEAPEHVLTEGDVEALGGPAKGPAANAKRDELVSYAVEHDVVKDEEELKGKKVAEIRELIDAHLAS